MDSHAKQYIDDATDGMENPENKVNSIESNIILRNHVTGVSIVVMTAFTNFSNGLRPSIIILVALDR